jgi:hypothetical protein
VSSELVELVKRDLVEVVNAEIDKFLKHYEECEKVDSILVFEDISIENYGVLIHGLRCEVARNIIVTSTSVVEIPQIKCWVPFWLGDRTKDMGYVEVVNVFNKCYVESRIFEGTIEEIAETIVAEAEAGE